ncbi:phosphatidate cytidylyltransferase [Anaerotalea alkaliphila]|uniref:Phosphatidate cytidylyltransferase n=1 Tax=Anaerotalea alkaliphila TaxID=2662126 RepID=A0A7X5HT28_9FIRM|nr:phosphatidate cytidylyltransferase [Anaerotalea alkaliphila]NDL66162.1 phosphatidate cytidylyltransferase [Anaerotalea alkaliphila]
MKTRILSSLVALPLVFGIIYLGGAYILGLLVLVTGLALFELNRAFKVRDEFLWIMPLLLSFWAYGEVFLTRQPMGLQTFAVLLLLLLSYYALRYPKVPFRWVLVSFFNYFYVVFLLGFLLATRLHPAFGSVLVWLVFVIAFGSDTFAYFTGVALGRHKLAPVVSPKKTVEGAVGGLLGSSLLGGLFGLFLSYKGILLGGNPFWLFALVGLGGSLLAQLGDLAASALKRESEVKDFGHLIPGHGGIVDRLDSIVFAAPYVYYAAMHLLD